MSVNLATIPKELAAAELVGAVRGDTIADRSGTVSSALYDDE